MKPRRSLAKGECSDSPGTGRLVRQFSVEPFGSSLFSLTDINGDGQLELLLLQTAGQLRAARSYDAGLGYPSVLADLNGDGLDEVLIASRQQVWIFASPEANT